MKTKSKASLVDSIQNVTTKNNECHFVEQVTTCQGCGYHLALVYYEIKYNGYRGRCPSCDGNWAES